jgi:integrase
MTRQITDCYQQTLSHLTPRSRSNRFCVLRQLCEYLARNNPCSYVPEPLKTSLRGLTHPIYTSESRAPGGSLQTAPPNSLRPHTYQTLLGLLYTTGIRISEALSVNWNTSPHAEAHHIAEASSGPLGPSERFHLPGSGQYLRNGRRSNHALPQPAIGACRTRQPDLPALVEAVRHPAHQAPRPTHP